MKRSHQISACLALAAINLCLALTRRTPPSGLVGAGADDNWNTVANWGGTAPVNADTLVFSGTTRQNNTNNISNLSVNALTFANNGFTLNGNLLALNGPLTNSAGTNIMAQGVNVTCAEPDLEPRAGLEVRFNGQFTNSTTANPLARWASAGPCASAAQLLSEPVYTLTSGSVIADGWC